MPVFGVPCESREYKTTWTAGIHNLLGKIALSTNFAQDSPGFEGTSLVYT